MHRLAQGPMAAGLRRGFGQQPHRGAGGGASLQKKVRLIVRCALSDLHVANFAGCRQAEQYQPALSAFAHRRDAPDPITILALLDSVKYVHEHRIVLIYNYSPICVNRLNVHGLHAQQ
ncbi:hypothetical protein TURU_054189 [Turdus rufiventris]|nr:hypothetical protein TURU_054189 [Turdus rufiventris]